MSIFYMDEIIIVNYTTDDNGVKTTHESEPISARVEDFNNLITDDRGQEVMADMLIFCETDINVTHEDYIKVTRKGGQSFYDPDYEWKVKKCPNIHNFKTHHKEIYI